MDANVDLTAQNQNLTPEEKLKKAQKIHEEFNEQLDELYLHFVDELDEIKKTRKDSTEVNEVEKAKEKHAQPTNKS